MVLSFFFSDQLRPVTSIAVYVARCIAATALLLSCLGCATIVKGPKQSIMFATVPEGAEIDYLPGPFVTPCLIPVAKSYSSVKVDIYRSGFALETVELKPKVGGWMFGNILFGGIIGVIVDMSTASNLYFDESNVRVELKPVSPETAAELDLQWAARKRARQDKIDALRKKRAEHDEHYS